MGYRIVCTRFPCNSAINLSKLNTPNLLPQLTANKSGTKPAVYEGETFRTAYTRAKKHFDEYRLKYETSWMWSHTLSHHGGEATGMSDYRFVMLGRFKDNLSRQVDEGWRQSELERLQREQRVLAMNSKIDFVKPFMTSLTVSKGSGNTKSGLKQPNP